MLGPIAIDPGRKQWKVLQLSRQGKRFRVVEAMSIPTDEFPASWNCSDQDLNEISDESRMLNRISKLCPELRGDGCVVVFPEADCRYEPYREAAEGLVAGDSEVDSDDFRWALCLPPTETNERRINDGLYLGVRSSAIRDWKRRLTQNRLALEGVVCPVQIAAAFQAEEDTSLMASLLDDSQGGRLVIHRGGQPVFTRRLKLQRNQTINSTLACASANAWSFIPSSTETKLPNVATIGQELKRTFDFVKTKTGRSIKQCVVHGELGTDTTSCLNLSASLNLAVIPWGFPEGTVLPDGLNSQAAIYSLAFAAAASRWELS